MVKLTAEVIHLSHQYTNAIKERELDLRGKVPAFFHEDSNTFYRVINDNNVVESSSRYLFIGDALITIIKVIDYSFIRLQNPCN